MQAGPEFNGPAQRQRRGTQRSAGLKGRARALRRGPGLGGDRQPSASEKAREFAMDRIKDRLEATDEQWADIQGPLTQVFDAMRKSAGIRTGGRSPGRRGAAQGSPPVPEAEALKAILLDKEADEEQVGEKVVALREAQGRIEKGLAEARNALRGGVTKRQEGVLILMGLLD